MNSGDFEYVPLVDEDQWSILLDAGGDDPRGLLEELRGLFQEDIEARLVALATADPLADVGMVTAHAHSVAGSASNLSAARLAAIAREIEARGQLSEPELASFVESLRETYGQTLVALGIKISNLG